jgi:hypothetical protein
MTRSIWTAVAWACAASAGLAAAAADRGITVTGCVQNFSSTGASGVTEHGYLLSDAKIVPEPGVGPVGTSGSMPPSGSTGTSGTAAAGMPASGTWAATSGTMMSAPRAKHAYRLEFGDRDLKDHVGHKVEVTGIVQPRPEGTPKSEEDRLQVASVRMLAAECSK